MSKGPLITKESNKSFEETYNALRLTIDENPNLKIILELDHSKNAASVDLQLEPTKIILFGNPKLGTVLMNDNQDIAIDLPQKIVVTKSLETVKVIYNNPAYLKDKHNLSDATTEVIAKVSMALDIITDKAIA